MKKFKFLLLIPFLLIIAIIVLFALEGWGRRDEDFAIVLFLSAFCFGLATSITWKKIGKVEQSNENSVANEIKSSQLKNAFFHSLFSFVTVFLITSSFIVYSKIKRSIETEECRVYVCSELINYDKQYPMNKKPEDLLALEQQDPLDTKYITENLVPNLKSEENFLRKMRETSESFPNGCGYEVYHLDANMGSLIHYKEIWLKHLLDENSERERYSSYEYEESIIETTEEADAKAVEEHYSKKGIIDKYKEVAESRIDLSCK